MSESKRKKLLASLKSSDIDGVQKLLNKPIDINFTSKTGSTPIFRASVSKNHKFLQMLLLKGGDVNLTAREDKLTPLHASVYNNRIESFNLLIDQPKINIDLLTSNGSSSLFLAVENGRVEMVRKLVQKGVKLTPRMSDRCSLLYMAAQIGNTKILEILIEQCQMKVDETTTNPISHTIYPTPLFIACCGNHTKAVKYLLRKGANPDTHTQNGTTPLHIVSQIGSVKIAKLLLSKRANINAPDSSGTPLLHAVRNGNLSIVNLFLKLKQTNINLGDPQSNISPLILALQCENAAITEALIAAGADVNLSTHAGYSPLHIAVMNKSLPFVQMLLAHNADPNPSQNTKKNSSSFSQQNPVDPDLHSLVTTPLFDAVLSDLPRIVKLLLRYGADPSQTVADDLHSPLFAAAFNGSIECGKALLTSHKLNRSVLVADPNILDPLGFSPIFYACQEGHYDFVQLLISNGADLTFQTIGGQTCVTPAFIASEYGHYGIVKLLAQHNCAIDVPRSLDNVTPVYLACQNGHVDTLHLLKHLGAAINIPRTDIFMTPLCIAAVQGNKSVVKAYLAYSDAEIDSSQSPSTSQPTPSERTHACIECVTNGHFSTLDTLFSSMQFN